MSKKNTHLENFITALIDAEPPCCACCDDTQPNDLMIYDPETHEWFCEFCYENILEKDK